MNSYPEPILERPVIVIGSGSHARVVIATLKAIGVEIIGLTDQREDKAAQNSEIDFLGKDEVIFNYPSDEVELVNGIGSLPGDSHRHGFDIEIDIMGRVPILYSRTSLRDFSWKLPDRRGCTNYGRRCFAIRSVHWQRHRN